MRNRARLPSSLTVALLLFAGSVADGSPPEADTLEPGTSPLQVAGSLRGMMHAGETGAQTSLATVLPNPRLYTVGALAELAGEVTVIGGEAYLSYPDGEEESRTETVTESDAGAALLVSAEVSSWRSVVAEEPVPFEELDEAVARLAGSVGLGPGDRFPFLVEGTFEELSWHVIDGRRLAGGGGSHGDHLSAAVRHSSDRATGTLVGFYSDSDQGVFTHMGSRTHVHCVVEAPLSAGHVDHVALPAGVVFKFPAGAAARPVE